MTMLIGASSFENLTKFELVGAFRFMFTLSGSTHFSFRTKHRRARERQLALASSFPVASLPLVLQFTMLMISLSHLQTVLTRDLRLERSD